MLTLVNSKQKRIVINPHTIEVSDNGFSRVWLSVENKVFAEFISRGEENFNQLKDNIDKLYHDIVTALRIGKDTVIDIALYEVK